MAVSPVNPQFSMQYSFGPGDGSGTPALDGTGPGPGPGDGSGTPALDGTGPGPGPAPDTGGM